MLRRNKIRFMFSLFLLTLYGFPIGIAGLNSPYDPIFMILTWLILTPIAGYFLGMLWQYDLTLRTRQDVSESTNNHSTTEKRKRERLDNVLRDLSDDDLVQLRNRLQDGTIDEDILYDRMVGDDGELVNRK